MTGKFSPPSIRSDMTLEENLSSLPDPCRGCPYTIFFRDYYKEAFPVILHLIELVEGLIEDFRRDARRQTRREILRNPRS